MFKTTPSLSQVAFAKAQKGSSITIAIFIVIVMSLLIAAITKSISSSSDQVVQEVLGTRALLAAESGNEMILEQIFPLNQAIPNLCTNNAVTTGARYLNWINGLNNCLVITTCANNIVNNETYYLIQSTGICKDNLAFDNTGAGTDLTCNNTDNACASRTIEIEARSL